ncbi:MAG: SsrA-binding protein SmpB [Fimbriimonadales bacterium]
MGKKSSSQDKKPEGGKSIQNRKARFDFELLDRYEAGVALVGSEVKSIWLGRANLTDAYVDIKDDEVWLVNLDIELYEHASHVRPERRRVRKLLLNRREIDTLHRKSLEKGLTIVPVALYFKNGKVKVEIALARGKREYDKRHQIAKDETRREVERMRKVRD